VSTSSSADEKTPLLAASKKQSEKAIVSRTDVNAAATGANVTASVSSKSALQVDVDLQIESSEVLSESGGASTVVLAALSDAASEALDDDETGNRRRRHSQITRQQSVLIISIVYHH
jgi:hypothetical protein